MIFIYFYKAFLHIITNSIYILLQFNYGLNRKNFPYININFTISVLQFSLLSQTIIFILLQTQTLNKEKAKAIHSAYNKINTRSIWTKMNAINYVFRFALIFVNSSFLQIMIAIKRNMKSKIKNLNLSNREKVFNVYK